MIDQQKGILRTLYMVIKDNRFTNRLYIGPLYLGGSFSSCF